MATFMLSSATRRYAALVLMLLAFSAFSCKDDEDDDNGTSRYTASADINIRAIHDQQRKLTVYGYNGTVDITGVADSDSIIITGERIVRANSQSEADNYLEELTISFQDYPIESWVGTTQPYDVDEVEFTVHYYISLPNSMYVKVDQLNGEIHVRDMVPEGQPFWTAEIEQLNGEIELRDNSGSVSAEVSNGSIVCSSEYAGADTCDLRATNGTIVLDISNDFSATFYASVVSGLVTVTGLDLIGEHRSMTQVIGQLGDGEGRIDLQVNNGTITVNGH